MVGFGIMFDDVLAGLMSVCCTPALVHFSFFKSFTFVDM